MWEFCADGMSWALGASVVRRWYRYLCHLRNEEWKLGNLSNRGCGSPSVVKPGSTRETCPRPVVPTSTLFQKTSNFQKLLQTIGFSCVFHTPVSSLVGLYAVRMFRTSSHRKIELYSTSFGNITWRINIYTFCKP